MKGKFIMEEQIVTNEKTQDKKYSLFQVIECGAEYCFRDDTGRSVEQLLKDFDRIGNVTMGDQCERIWDPMDFLVMKQDAQDGRSEKNENGEYIELPPDPNCSYIATIDKDHRELSVYRNGEFEDFDLYDTIEKIKSDDRLTLQDINKKDENNITDETDIQDVNNTANRVNTQNESDITDKVNTQDESKIKDSSETQKFLENFLSEQQTAQNSKINKLNETVSKMTDKIQKLHTDLEDNRKTTELLNTVMKSNSYPALNPIIMSVKKVFEQSAKAQSKQIAKAEKKLNKANRKIQKINGKVKTSQLLKDFISAFNSNKENRQEAVIAGILSVKNNSLLTHNERLNKINGKIDRLNQKLEKSDLTDTDKIKINTKLQKQKNKKEKSESKINNLIELEQDLNKLAKTELIENKIDELKDTLLNAVEQSITANEDIETTVDNIAENSAKSIKDILENIPKAEKNSDLNVAEEEKQQQQLVIDQPVKIENVTQAQLIQISKSGILFGSVRDENNNATVVCNKADVDKIKNIIDRKIEKNAGKQNIKSDNKDKQIKQKLDSYINEDLIYFGEITLETANRIKEAGYRLSADNDLIKVEQKQNKALKR